MGYIQVREPGHPLKHASGTSGPERIEDAMRRAHRRPPILWLSVSWRQASFWEVQVFVRRVVACSFCFGRFLASSRHCCQQCSADCSAHCSVLQALLGALRNVFGIIPYYTGIARHPSARRKTILKSIQNAIKNGMNIDGKSIQNSIQNGASALSA